MTPREASCGLLIQPLTKGCEESQGGSHEAVQGGGGQEQVNVGNKFFEVLSRVQMYEFTSLRRDTKDYETI